MSLNRILDGLEQSTATGAQAFDHARCGFLEWAVSVKGPVTPVLVRAALSDPAVLAAESAAAQAFVGYLEQACRTTQLHRPRRGRVRILH
ncbi:hypothetical protein [Roseovarius sp.]|uniref:hypothetical protein n=1 Tax=Roseovarius sp. TaxID=1486281 RepID=UPI0025D39A17|nr:hypothetical protein [Roseovarius sp.]